MRRRPMSLPAIALACALVPITAGALEEPVADFDACVAPHAADGSFNGVVLVARDGEVLHEAAYGDADEDAGVPLTLDHRFKIFSTTKQITAAAVLLLHEDKALSIDDQLARFIPEAPEPWRAVRIHQLLNHSSGIPDHVNMLLDHYTGDDQGTMRAVFEALEDDSLLHEPGERFSYSNYGYQLLLVVIERASGRSFDAFLRERVFEPVGMANAGVELADMSNGKPLGALPVPNLAVGYNGEPGDLRPARSLMFVNAGAGGVYASAADLLAYDAALRDKRLLRDETVRLARDRAIEIRPGVSYAGGWIVREHEDGLMTYEHSGGTNGYTSQFLRAPEEGLCVIVLANRGFALSGRIARDLLEAARSRAPADRASTRSASGLVSSTRLAAATSTDIAARSQTR